MNGQKTLSFKQHLPTVIVGLSKSIGIAFMPLPWRINREIIHLFSQR